MSFRQVRNPHMKNKRGHRSQRSAVALPGARRRSRSRSVGGRDRHECCIHLPEDCPIARISRPNQRTRHHSIARARFYAFFLTPYRIRTLENRFSSLTIHPPLPETAIVSACRISSSGHTHAQTCTLCCRRLLFPGQPNRTLCPDRHRPPWSCSASPAFRQPIPPAPRRRNWPQCLPGAQQADADHLRDALAAPSTRLLVLP